MDSARVGTAEAMPRLSSVEMGYGVAICETAREEKGGSEVSPELESLAKLILEKQLVTQDTLTKLADAQLRTQEAIGHLTITVDKYVDAADARMKRIEENLDGLIRAITREHSNGKERH
jgi:hypothetical protein